MGKATRVDFCCCVFPVINAGAYATILWTAVLALLLAILSVATPTIVATSTALPSGWPKIIVLLLGLVLFAWQALGAFSVARQRTSLYRTYIRVNVALVLATVVLLLVFIAVSAARHSQALQSCAALYGNTPVGDAGVSLVNTDSVGQDICNIWIWVQVGVMAFLTIFIALNQLYMCWIQRVYGREQRQAMHDYKAADGLGDHIPLAARESTIWDPHAADGRRDEERVGRGDDDEDDDYDAPRGHDEDVGVDGRHRPTSAPYYAGAGRYAQGGGRGGYDDGGYAADHAGATAAAAMAGGYGQPDYFRGTATTSQPYAGGRAGHAAPADGYYDYYGGARGTPAAGTTAVTGGGHGGYAGAEPYSYEYGAYRDPYRG